MGYAETMLAQRERGEDCAELAQDATESDIDRLAGEVRGAILAGDAAAIVPHVSIAGTRIHTMLTEVMADHMHDQDSALLRLISCAALGDAAGAAEAAETIISTVAWRHAEDVCERIELSGEVMA